MIFGTLPGEPVYHASVADLYRVTMVLDIRVVYKPPSKEWLFLGFGWGAVRDLRGPYLTTPLAEIVIGNWALSQTVASTLGDVVRV